MAIARSPGTKVYNFMLERFEPAYHTEESWTEFLFKTYQTCRLFPGWKTIFDNHDEEDQQYFVMLDDTCLKNPDSILMEVPR